MRNVLLLVGVAWLAFVVGREEGAYRECRSVWRNVSEAAEVWRRCDDRFANRGMDVTRKVRP